MRRLLAYVLLSMPFILLYTYILIEDGIDAVIWVFTRWAPVVVIMVLGYAAVALLSRYNDHRGIK